MVNKGISTISAASNPAIGKLRRNKVISNFYMGLVSIDFVDSSGIADGPNQALKIVGEHLTIWSFRLTIGKVTNDS